MKLFLLGAPYLEVAGKTVTIPRRKVMALLMYLAVKGEPQRRETLASLLWPDSSSRLAYGSLRRTLSELNQALGGDGVTSNREMIGINPHLDLWLDVVQFQQGLADCTQATPNCLDCLREAVSLYRDDFLAGFTLPDAPDFDEWQFFQNESLRQTFAVALQNLCYLYRQQGAYEQAITHARRWLALDPLHESAHRVLMALYAQAGQQAAALRQYQVCVETLAAELGVAPAEETTGLYERIRAGGLSHVVTAEEIGETIPPFSPLPQFAPAVPVEKAARGHNLPPQHTSFIGRERELIEIARLLGDEPDCRLLTLFGPGGVGKTRLALRAAEQARAHFPAGVYFVSLAEVSSPEFMVGAIADALSISLSDDARDPNRRLFDWLAEKEWLLVLDNFEHLLAGVDLISELLVRAPRLKLLITSRARLNLQEEWGFEVEGMRYPLTEETEGQALETYSAVLLFTERARRAQADFQLTATDVPAVLQICQLVDGMPLGIELAAFWLRLLSCQEIAHRIKRSLDFLTTTIHNVPERHRSLRAVFESSWQLLTEEEHAALGQLAVFRGGFHRRAAARVAGATLPLLSALADKSLLQRDRNGRYKLHELLRQFVAEKLQERGDEYEQTRDRHCAYFASFLQARDPQHMKGREQKETFQALLAEADNLRMAWWWAIERGHLDTATKFVEGFAVIAAVHGSFHEMIHIFDKALLKLKAPSETGAQTASSGLAMRFRGQLLSTQATFYRHIGLLEHAQALCEESLTCLAAVEPDHDNARIHANAKLGLGQIFHQQGNFARAVPFYQEALDYFEKCGDQYEMASVMVSSGLNAFYLGAYPEAERLLERSISILVDIGEDWRKAFALHTLGGLIYAQVQGDYQRAEKLVEESLRISQELGDQLGIGFALQHLGTVMFLAGDHVRARQRYQESLTIARATDSRTMKLAVLNGLGAVALTLGQVEAAHHWYEESVAISDLVGQGKQAPEALIGLGNVACALGEYAQAQHYFTQALRTRIRSAGETLAAIMGGADLLGRTTNPEKAAELAAFAMRHPAAMQITRAGATRLLSEVAARLPPAVVAAATARGQTLNLEATAADLLLRLGG